MLGFGRPMDVGLRAAGTRPKGVERTTSETHGLRSRHVS